MRPKSVLVVYPFLQHYRRGVFMELDRSDDPHFTFAADTHGQGGIASMDPSDLHRFRRLRTRRILGIELQTGLLSLIGDRFDAVVFYGDVRSLSTWLGAAYARLRGRRVYFWTIGWHRPDTGVKRTVRLAFYHLAHHLLVYGNIGRNIGIQMGYPGQRITVIGNSISLDPSLLSHFEPPPALDGSGRILVGAVARLTAVKRFDLLIDACEILRKKGFDARIKLAGAGSCRQSLERQASAARVPMKFVGPIYSNVALAEFYQDLDATVVPQAIGLTAVQSLGFGIPAISDDNPYAQMPEWESIIPGTTGETYARDDPSALANSILQVTMREAGRPAARDACLKEYAARWSPVVHAENICRALTS
jgi:glycosyltransferase involved in cell wall biosynthesis